MQVVKAEMVLWTAGFVLLTLVINAPLLPYILRLTGLNKGAHAYVCSALELLASARLASEYVQVDLSAGHATSKQTTNKQAAHLALVLLNLLCGACVTFCWQMLSKWCHRAKMRQCHLGLQLIFIKSCCWCSVLII